MTYSYSYSRVLEKRLFIFIFTGFGKPAIHSISDQDAPEIKLETKLMTKKKIQNRARAEVDATEFLALRTKEIKFEINILLLALVSHGKSSVFTMPGFEEGRVVPLYQSWQPILKMYG